MENLSGGTSTNLNILDLITELALSNKNVNYLVQENSKLKDEIVKLKKENSDYWTYKYNTKEFFRDINYISDKDEYELDDDCVYDHYESYFKQLSKHYEFLIKENKRLQGTSSYDENKKLQAVIAGMQIEQGEQLKRRDEEIQLKIEQLSEQYRKNLSRIKEEYLLSNYEVFEDEYQSPYK